MMLILLQRIKCNSKPYISLFVNFNLQIAFLLLDARHRYANKRDFLNPLPILMSSTKKVRHLERSFRAIYFLGGESHLFTTPRPRAALLMCLKKYSAIGNSAI